MYQKRIIAAIASLCRRAALGAFHKTSWPRRFSLALLVACMGLSAAGAEVSYSGRAFGAWVRLVNPQPNVLVFSDTGDLPPAGGSLSATLVSIQVGVGTLGSRTVTAAASGGAMEASSFASQEEVLAFSGQPAQLSASLVRADARAECGGVQGSSVIANLTFGGMAVTVSGQPNQTVTIPAVATLIINEQIVDSTSITVNALHLTLGTGEEVILSSAHSDIGCPLAGEEATWGTVKSLYRD